jgi:hypothetical protein
MRATEFSAGTVAATGYFNFDYYGKSLIYADDMPLVLGWETIVVGQGGGAQVAQLFRGDKFGIPVLAPCLFPEPRFV